MRKLSVAKFGGGLLDPEGRSIPLLLGRIREIRERDGFGPVVVFSAPSGYTDELVRIGESCAASAPVAVDSIFGGYENVARRFVKDESLPVLLSSLNKYRRRTEDALAQVNKRFQGNTKARVLTNGGELPTSALMAHIMRSVNVPSSSVGEDDWPVVTDDNFENASPRYDSSRVRVESVIGPLEKGEVVSLAGFLGVTTDGLETILGRGGSDLTAVFVSCLLKEWYQVETILFKEVSVQSADPRAVGGQETEHVASLTYNEAHKASMMGMKIVQDSAIQVARRFQHPLKVVPIQNPEEYTTIQSEDLAEEIVKCITGKAGCAVLSMHDEKSRSLEDSLRIWEGLGDFLELGTEMLETGEKIRDFLFLDSGFLRRNEERLKGFDEGLTIEHGVGVVTLIGDRMKDSPGVASTAIGSMPGINIKRAVFAPHTSQIILVVEERNVNAAVAAIHRRRDEMNGSGSPSKL